MSDDPTDETVSRRNVLRNGAVAAGALAVGVGATGSAAAELSGATGKRGGRGQLDGEVRRNEPFTLMPDGTDTRPASCFADESAPQTYLTYTINYCDSDDDEDGTLYVLPDEAELVDTDTYVVRSVTPCRESDLSKVAIGPAREDC